MENPHYNEKERGELTRQVSAENFTKIKRDGLLSKSRMKVYEVLHKYGPLSAGEITQALVGYTRNSVCSKLCQLRDLGLVYERGTTICPLTHNRVTLWDDTGRLPDKEKERKVQERRIKTKGALEDDIARLEAEKKELARLASMVVANGQVRVLLSPEDAKSLSRGIINNRIKKAIRLGLANHKFTSRR